MTARSDWDRAVTNFRRYLPRTVDHWVVVIDPVEHGRIATELTAELSSVELVAVDDLAPGTTDVLLDRARQRPGMGLLDFSGVDGGRALSADEREVRTTLGSWPHGRIKRCFDVWDENFAALFSEDPLEVRRRCQAVTAALGAHEHLEYLHHRDSRGLSIHCDPSRWTAYTGFEEFDFILPSGEVSTLPLSVDGSVEVDGWIVGTMPFGMKYGRISRGDLVMELSRGEVTAVSGTNRELCADLETAFDRLPGLGSVGEFGIGQSRAVVDAAGLHERACLWHERHLGVHLGLGVELPEVADPERDTTTHHLDVVLATGSLTAGGSVLVEW